MTVIIIAIGVTAFGAIGFRFFGHAARVPQKAQD
jgi:hypothetical protein